METQPESTGLDLKLERTAARVTARSIALVMGVGSTRISAIEAAAYVTPETAARYRAALGTCITERTSRAEEVAL